MIRMKKVQKLNLKGMICFFMKLDVEASLMELINYGHKLLIKFLKIHTALGLSTRKFLTMCVTGFMSHVCVYV